MADTRLNLDWAAREGLRMARNMAPELGDMELRLHSGSQESGWRRHACRSSANPAVLLDLQFGPDDLPDTGEMDADIKSLRWRLESLLVPELARVRSGAQRERVFVDL